MLLTKGSPKFQEEMVHLGLGLNVKGSSSRVRQLRSDPKPQINLNQMSHRTKTKN